MKMGAYPNIGLGPGQDKAVEGLYQPA